MPGIAYFLYDVVVGHADTRKRALHDVRLRAAPARARGALRLAALCVRESRGG